MAGGSKTGNKKSGDVVPLRPTRPCPICSQPSTRANFPFCSKRCADIDLNRWLTETYVIPAAEEGLSSDPETGNEDDR